MRPRTTRTRAPRVPTPPPPMMSLDAPAPETSCSTFRMRLRQRLQRTVPPAPASSAGTKRKVGPARRKTVSRDTIPGPSMGAANGDDSMAAGDSDMADVDKEFYDPGEDEHDSTSSPQAGPSKKRRERGPTCFQSLQKLVQEPDRVKTCEIITETEVNGEKVSVRCGASLPLDDVHAAVCHWRAAHTKRGQRDNRRQLTCGWGGCTYQTLYTPLMRHVIEEHLAVRFKCPRCSYTTHRKDSLDNHRNAKNH
ncbi:hypothetical protein C8Q76DRAFT_737056 [Earliella scabrosa]|nr:hypothetical protein C8Q76DRAFT_737056 [Earliella scabrosa]